MGTEAGGGIGEPASAPLLHDLSDRELDGLVERLRVVVVVAPPDDPQRPAALARLGAALIERAARGVAGMWPAGVDAIFAQFDPHAWERTLSAIPDLDADLDEAVEALTSALGRQDPNGAGYAGTAADLGTALVLRHDVHGLGGDETDLREGLRMLRIAADHPAGTGEGRRRCASILMFATFRRVFSTGLDFGMLRPGGRPTPAAGAPPSPSQEADLDVLLGILERFVETGAGAEDPQLATALKVIGALRGGGGLPDQGMSAFFSLLGGISGQFEGQPALQAVLRWFSSMVGTELAGRAAAPPDIAGQVTELTRLVLGGLPAGNPLAQIFAAQSALGPPPAVSAWFSNTGPKDEVPPKAVELEPFDLRVAVLFGAEVAGRLAVTSGQALAALELLPTVPDRPDRQAAVLVVTALARHSKWLHERDPAHLTSAVERAREAVDCLGADDPLGLRAAESLAGLLLDRCRLSGGRADLDEAVAILEGLLTRAAGGPAVPGLHVLLRRADDRIGGILAPESADSSYPAQLEAALGSALLLSVSSAGPVRSEDVPILAESIARLERAADGISAATDRGQDVRSDLAVARLSYAAAVGDRSAVGEAVDELLRAAAECPPKHPRRPTIRLRAVGAMLAHGTGEYRLEHLDHGINLLDQALLTAGPGYPGERSRCLYGLGHLLLAWHVRDPDAVHVRQAVIRLEEARAGLEPAPGDPFEISLLRTLALAYRIAAVNGAGTDRVQSVNIARSTLHAHARATLLQSSPHHGLTAARPIGRDMRRLVEWCLEDGRPESAVEAVEVGRGILLHGATVAADIPKLLRDAGEDDLAESWGADASDDLRRRVLAALDRGDAERRLISAPAVPDLAAVLRTLRMDALVYLLPGGEDGLDGRALGVGADGAVWECPLPALAVEPGGALDRYAAAQLELLDRSAGRDDDAERGLVARRDFALRELCDWAWFAAVGPILRRLTPPDDGPAPTRPNPADGGSAPLRLTPAADVASTSAAPRLSAGSEPTRPTPADVGGTAPPRLVLVPVGALAMVPWHAASREEPAAGADSRICYACEDAVFSTCASARQLMAAAARPSLPRDGLTVFVANPTRDIWWSSFETEDICSAYYPDAVVLGKTGERVPAQGLGTPDEVLAYLPAGAGEGHDGAALLHLGCHGRAAGSPDLSHLLLAEDDPTAPDLGRPLPVHRILAQAHGRRPADAGGLVVLASCDSDLALVQHDEALTLASAFLAAGSVTVVGSRWEVPNLPTALLMFMFHHYLVQYPDGAAVDALRQAQLWMLDPHRRPLETMPARMADEAASPVLADIASWAAFTHHGR